MKKQNSTAQQGLNESVNAVNNDSTVINPQPLFAVTKGNIGTAVPWTAEQIAQELATPQLKAHVEEVRAEPDEQKQKALKEQKKFDIIGICPHYYGFRDNHRAADEALPECCTYKTSVDVDDRQFGQQAIEGALRLNEQPGMWHNKVLYIEHSLRGGGKCHIWLILPVGMTVVETQQAFCKALDISCDDSVQQKQSFILMTGDVVYQSPLWLQPLSQNEIEARQTAFTLRGLDIDGWGKSSGHAATPSATTDNVPVSLPADSGIAEPTDSTDYIFEECMREAEVRPADLLIETDPGRHNSVRAILSVGLPQLLTKAECNGQLRQRAPQYWPTADCQRLVDDFYAKYTDTSAKLTKFQRRVLAQSQHLADKNYLEAASNGPASQPVCDELTLSEIYASPVPPRMNRKQMPRVVKTVTSRTPDKNLECVSQAIFPPLEAHPVGFSARYIDNRYRELRANCVAVAETGWGKGCVDQPIKHIMSDVRSESDENRKKEQDYFESYNILNSNLNKPRRDKYCIRNLMPDVTQAALVRRTAEAEGAPLYARLNEIEQFDKIESASGPKNSFTNLKLNDDEGNDFGQERAGTQSVNAATSLHLNWNASTTPGKLIRYFRYVMNDGPISRLTLATIPDPGIAAECPVFGDYDERYDAVLKPFIDNLNAATGKIDCRQARQMIKELKAECDEFAIASGDRVFDNLTHRALVHVFRKAICIYAANGMKWEKSIKPFCRWSLHYDLWLKMHYFGDYIRKADEEIPVSKHGPRNMLELLPDEFTLTDLANVRFNQGKDREGSSNQIYQWVHRGLVLHLTDDRYKKVPKKL
jgi:hypothetical protein